MSERAAGGASLARSLRIGALGVWAGALLLTGAAAAVAFPTMRDLAPLLPKFAAHPDDHWSIAAGHIMRRVFSISDWAQIACALVVLATLAAELFTVGWKRLGMAWRVRGAIALVAAQCLAYSALALAPRMNGLLDVYWEAARSGDIAAAQDAKAQFDRDHVLARRMMTGVFALVVAALLTSALSGARGANARREAP